MMFTGSCLLALAVANAPSPTSTWTEPPASSLQDLYGVRWKQELKRFELLATNYEQWTQPAFSEDGSRVFVGTKAGRIEARTVEDGALLWKMTNAGVVGASMLAFDTSIIMGIDSDIVAFDQQQGRERWRLGVGGSIGGQAIRSEHIGVFPIRPNAYVAIDLRSGERLWQAKRPTPEALTIRGQASAGIDDVRGIAYLGFSDGRLSAVDLKKGTTRWTTTLGTIGEYFADIDSQPLLVDEGSGILAAAYNTGLFRVDAETGSVVWQRKDLQKITALKKTATGEILAGYGEGQMLGLSGTGQVIWRYRLKNGAPCRPILLPEHRVAVGSNRGPVAILDTRTGRPLQLIPTGSGTSAPPAASGDDLAILTNGGLFFATRARAGGRILLH